MGLHRIVLEGFTYPEMAKKAAEKAKEAIQSDVSLSKVDVVVHPGQPDEERIKIYRASGYEEA